MKFYSIYARLSDEETRANVDAGVLESIQKEMRDILNYCQVYGIHYIGPAPDKIKDRSIPEQISMCLEWLRSHQLKCYSIHVDYDVSGSVHIRKALTDMLSFAAGSKIQGVIMKDDKRFARDVRMQENVLAELFDLGIEVHTVLDDDQYQDRSIRRLKGSINEMAVDDGRKNFKRRLKKFTESKKPLFDPPWGYRWNPRRENWLKIKDKETVERFLADAKEYLSGNLHIQVMMDRYQVSDKTIRNRLERVKCYAGLVVYRLKKKSHVTGAVIGQEIQEYVGLHEPYITLAQAEELYALLVKPRGKHNGPKQQE